jgi:hypothetical protein
VLELYQMGSEDSQWWAPWPDTVSGQPTPKGIWIAAPPQYMSKIIENFGGSEVLLGDDRMGRHVGGRRHPVTAQCAGIIYPALPMVAVAVVFPETAPMSVLVPATMGHGNLEGIRCHPQLVSRLRGAARG